MGTGWGGAGSHDLKGSGRVPVSNIPFCGPGKFAPKYCVWPHIWPQNIISKHTTVHSDIHEAGEY